MKSPTFSIESPRSYRASVLIDTHCHLDDPVYDGDREAVLKRAAACGVGRLVTIGTNLTTSRRAVELARQFPQVAATVGIHPHDAAHWTAEADAALAMLGRDPSVVAVGEVGLDYYRNPSPREVQHAALRRALGLAQRLRLPVVVHCRDAWDDLLGMLREHAPLPRGGVLHCFTGDPKALAAALDLGLMISFAGNLTFKNAGSLREVARQAPMDRVVLETDAPYLAPQPHRGRRNEPAYVAATAACLSTLKGVPVETVARITTDAARRLFGFDLGDRHET